ncbi:MAG TPA: hypothetical protein IAD24_02200 [Candidatus Aphodomorpha intestinavium]|uniref:Uncharacterized protein n=1 Tax=Candidatus Aphodomorpha intestinavium TaxID=2840672 RepID=A0A9D1N3A1_9FIRM|nr:hypothetical protein [Candidatus Aphodomorpha intestinavium]
MAFFSGSLFFLPERKENKKNPKRRANLSPAVSVSKRLSRKEIETQRKKVRKATNARGCAGLRRRADSGTLIMGRWEQAAANAAGANGANDATGVTGVTGVTGASGANSANGAANAAGTGGQTMQQASPAQAAREERPARPGNGGGGL